MWQSETTSEKLDLNVATKMQLEELKGIGPKKAQIIIEERPFKSIDDLLRVRGIGEKTVENLKNTCFVNDSVFPTGLPEVVHNISLLDPFNGHECKTVSVLEYQNITLPNPGILMLHINAGHYRSSLKNLEKTLIRNANHLPDVICVSDTGNREVSELFLSKYEILKFPPCSNPLRGKGVAIFVKRSNFLLYKRERSDLNFDPTDCNNVWLELCFGNMYNFVVIVVGVIYRNPRHRNEDIGKFKSNLKSTITKIQNQTFYIFGDININLRKYDTRIAEYCKMLKELNCKLLITQPTRVTLDKDDNKFALLDHIYTNDANLHCITAGVVDTFEISDHYPIYCVIDFSNQTFQKKLIEADVKYYSTQQMQSRNPFLKSFGIPYNPCVEIDLRVYEYKGLETLNCFQYERLHRWSNSLISFKIPFGYINIEVFGVKILNQLVEIIFNNEKQSYLIPVYHPSHPYQPPFAASASLIQANTRGTVFGVDSEWVFVPTYCVFFCQLAICF